MSPPYTDHHVHLMATAAARLSIDVSAAGTVAEMGRILRRGIDPRERGWARAWGYEEWALAEGRHPSREDLDRAVPDRPLVLHHRTGHAAVLNTPALDAVGAPDHPDGVLVDRHDLLARVPRLDPGGMERAAASVSREWAAEGINAIVDATHTNGPEELATFRRWREAGAVRQAMTAMVAPAHAAELGPPGRSIGGVVTGPVKLMPDPRALGDLSGQVAGAHSAGFPVAVHVVDFDVLDAVLDAIVHSPPPPGTADRIEHNALCLPDQVDRIAAAGAVVVVNPSFLIHRRAKYELEVPEVERAWLIRIGSLLRAGVKVRAGSDSPVVPARPGEMMAAAMAHPFSPDESVGRQEAEQLLAK